MATETYLITDTLNDKADTGALKKAIDASAITKKCLTVSKDDLNIYINFAEALPPTEKTNYLDSIISSHDGISLEEHTLVENVVPIGGPKVQNKGFSFTATAGQSTAYDYTLAEPTLLASGFMFSEGHDFFDSLTLELVHPLGGVQHTYCENYPVNPNGLTIIPNDAVTAQDLQGLIIRVTYNSTGVNDVKCNCGMDGRRAE
jgi:hypothetical protein